MLPNTTIELQVPGPQDPRGGRPRLLRVGDAHLLRRLHGAHRRRQGDGRQPVRRPTHQASRRAGTLLPLCHAQFELMP